MIRLLLRAAVFLGSAAIGILVAVWLLDDMSVSAAGFVTVVLIFAVAQSLLSPFITKVAMRNASAFLGGIGLVSTFVSLLLASWFGSLSISGIGTWIAATVLVWLVTAIATFVLPYFVLKSKATGAKS